MIKILNLRSSLICQAYMGSMFDPQYASSLQNKTKQKNTQKNPVLLKYV